MSTMTEEDTIAPAIGSDPRWAAVLARDARCDGRFYYSVRTTGVYCRPSCASRTARPENVAFHETAADAERAGFRPCRRCRPDKPALAQRHALMVADLCRYIAGAQSLPTLGELAQRSGMSAYHLHRVFKSITGLTPRAYAAAHRRERITQNLARSASVTDAVYAAGYGSSGPFYAESDAMLGMTPRRFRAGGAGTEIRFATGRCSLGAILVASSERGVCAILLGDDAHALARELAVRFPRAKLARGDAHFERCLAQVVALVEAPRLGLDLPLDVRGTAFQQRVWQALRAIPAGSTVSYTELAASIGAPRSVRAVARACASNPVAVAIPCHRVVRSDGDLAGYRWGLERKRALLEKEAAGKTETRRAPTRSK
jgi:AraC family transcriptional regulator of adaptative response/methylated-DNA-[protein]-cysteine methyltransferase